MFHRRDRGRVDVNHPTAADDQRFTNTNLNLDPVASNNAIDQSLPHRVIRAFLTDFKPDPLPLSLQPIQPRTVEGPGDPGTWDVILKPLRQRHHLRRETLTINRHEIAG